MKRRNIVLLAIGTALVLRSFIFDFIIAQGQSMEPAIKDGSVLVVSRLRYGFRLPVPGKNGQPKYLIRWDIPREGEVVVFNTPMGDKAVKRCTQLLDNGFFFAEGDNENASYDSRAYGPVPFDNIIGKVLGY